jgi:hypothetical protein
MGDCIACAISSSSNPKGYIKHVCGLKELRRKTHRPESGVEVTILWRKEEF